MIRKNTLRNVWDQLLEEHPEAMKGWTLVFNSRMRSFCGRCCYGPKEVHIAEWHRKQSPASEVEDTLRHEVAHILAPGEGHSKAWKAACRKVGAKPQRLAGEGIRNTERRKPKWKCECKACGRTWDRRRRVNDWHDRSHICPDGERGQILWLDRRSGDVFEGCEPGARRWRHSEVIRQRRDGQGFAFILP